MIGWRTGVIVACLALACGRGPTGGPETAGTVVTEDPVVTSRDQLDGLVGSRVAIVGIQSRTKIMTVVGVDIDGIDALSDRVVIARGVLRRHVVTEVDPYSANRGAGKFYSLVDPRTGQLAATEVVRDTDPLAGVARQVEAGARAGQ